MIFKGKSFNLHFMERAWRAVSLYQIFAVCYANDFILFLHLIKNKMVVATFSTRCTSSMNSKLGGSHMKCRMSDLLISSHLSFPPTSFPTSMVAVLQSLLLNGNLVSRRCSELKIISNKRLTWPCYLQKPPSSTLSHPPISLSHSISYNRVFFLFVIIWVPF